jgi:hypothetical protein
LNDILRIPAGSIRSAPIWSPVSVTYGLAGQRHISPDQEREKLREYLKFVIKELDGLRMSFFCGICKGVRTWQAIVGPFLLDPLLDFQRGCG